MSINRVVIIGRLTRDPELRTTTAGKSVCSFSVAVQKRIKPDDGPDADFFSVSAWGKTAEFVSNYLQKGRLIAVDGRLQSRRYTTSDGTSRETTEIIADTVQALDKTRDEGKSPAPAVTQNVTDPDFDIFADE